MELALLLHASDLVVVARVDSIEDATSDAAPARGSSGWVRQVDDVRQRGRRVHAEPLETLRGAAARGLEFFALPHEEGGAPDAIAGRTDLFLLADAARGGGEPPVYVVLARFALSEVAGRRSVDLTARVTVDGAPRPTLPFEELERMIAASHRPALRDR
jgi:hypothetical protein